MYQLLGTLPRPPEQLKSNANATFEYHQLKDRVLLVEAVDRVAPQQTLHFIAFGTSTNNNNMSSQPQDIPLPPPPSSTTSTNKRKNKKKRKKRTSSTLPSDGGDNNLQSDNNDNTIIRTTILHSKLSLKKQAFLKKSAKSTPWYDVNELLEVGRGLLVALKLFPSPTSSSASPQHDHGQQQQQQSNNDDGGCDNNAVVPAGLSPEEYTQLKSALRRVALWRGRRGGKLPHAIDMTAGLAEILLMDAEQSATTASIYQLRNTYSTLLLRSVNGLADTYRHQRTSATLSVSHCCSLAGLPTWIVDIRHDASHNDLPSLGVCRIGALESLKFWGKRYWDSLEERVWGNILRNGEEENDDGGGGELSDGMGLSTSTMSQEGGICTLAMDCLGRYQRAAIVEARDREEQRLSKLQKRVQQQNQQLQEQNTTKKDEQNIQQKETSNKKVDDDGVTMKDSIDCATQDGISNKTDAKDVTLTTTASDGANSKKRASKAQETGSTNPWSILSDDKPKKKKKAKMTTTASKNLMEMEENQTEYDAAPASTTLPPGNDKEEEGKKQPPLPLPSSRDCAAEYVRTIPLDVAYSMALQFLVWGKTTAVNRDRNTKDSDGARDDEVDGPALIALPLDLALPTRQTVTSTKSVVSSASQQLDASFEQLRTMYEPLLIAMITAYPGFVSALFVHLVDSILCLDGARRDHLININNTDGASCEDDTLDMDQLEFNLQYLSRWVRYLLSRGFHMNFDRSVALFIPKDEKHNPVVEPSVQSQLPPAQVDPSVESQSSTLIDASVQNEAESEQKPLPQPIDLKKKGRKKWTTAQLEYMQGSLDYSSLNEVGFPLNSVCDRLLLHQQDLQKNSKPNNKDSSARTVVGDLMKYLEDVIGKERVAFLGIFDKRSCGASCDVRNDDTVALEGETSASSDLAADNKEPTKKATSVSKDLSQTANTLSLEDMEAMLVDTDTKDGTVDKQPNSPAKNDTGQSMADCEEKPSLIKPWCLCKHWDACAIGTMPGYPS